MMFVMLVIMLINNVMYQIVLKNKKSSIKIGILTLIDYILLIWKNPNIPFFLVILVMNNIMIFTLEYQNFKKIKQGYQKLIFTICCILTISILLELTVFNFRSYTTLHYKEIDLTDQILKTNLTPVDAKERTYIVTEDKIPYIEFRSINKKIHNIYFDIDDQQNDVYTISSMLTDEANQMYYQVNNRQIHHDIPVSKVLTYQTSGKSKKTKFTFTFERNDHIKINKVIANYRRPIQVNLIRLVLVFMIILFVYYLRPKSNLYQIEYKNYKYKKLLIGFLVVIIISSFSVLGSRCLLALKNPTANVYNKLSHSLLEGKTYVTDGNHSEKILKTMDNPYDTLYRDTIFRKQHKEYLWDCAFYKGKYYSYFGVVPVIIFYIPHLLLTGKNLDSSFLSWILSILLAISLIYLLHQVVTKIFKKCSVGLFILLTLVLVYCTGILYFLKMPTLYGIPIASGLLFTYLGLNILISCIGSDKHIYPKLFFGALCMALVAGCRPQLLLGSLLVLPIAYLYLKNNKETKKSLAMKIFVFCIPYIIVAILLMYYNYIRFQSPFDFGANYNLTTNDMTKRGFVIDRIPLGIIMFFFNPVNIQNVFPFIIETPLATNYLGTTIYEPIYGGVFFSVMFTSINLFIYRLKNKIDNKLIYKTCIICIISALVIAVADTEMAGILARYINDFLWLLIFSSTLIVLSIHENNKISKKVLIPIVFGLISISLIYQGFYSFTSILNQFKNNNIHLWLEFYYLIQFWL